MEISSKWKRLVIFAASAACASSLSFAIPPDETPPTVPGNFIATPISSSRIDLSWAASSDARGVTGYNVNRCQGANCVYLVTTPSTQRSFSNTGLPSGATYQYLVTAFDAAGNISEGASATATTFDVVAPSAPSALTATVVSGSRIDLSWPASSDNVGVSGYQVEMCTGVGCGNFNFFGSSGTNSFSATSLGSGVYHTFRVRAYDAVPNYGSYSPNASQTTLDVVAPGTPPSLSASPASGTRIDLSWPTVSDNVSVAAYDIESCQGSGCSNFASLGSTGSTAYSATGLAPATSYRYRVRARDAVPNYGGYSPVAAATTVDTIVPSTPATISASATSGTAINVTWAAASDNVAVTGYAVEACQGAGCSSFAQVGTTGATSFDYIGLVPATSYSLRVRAYDAASNYSGYTTTATAVTRDTVPPNTPGSVTATPSSATAMNVSWAPSTDNVGVVAYHLERCQGAGCSSFVEIGTTVSGVTTFGDSSLTGSTTYRYRVRARDAFPNYSGYGGPAQATTLDGQAPSVPGSFMGSGSGTSATLSWAASTDNVGVAGYNIERCLGSACSNFVEIGTPTASPFGDSGLAAGSTYRYRVRARDTVPNYSDYAGPINVATSDTQAPTSPTSLGTTLVSATRVDLSWTAGTDNVGIVGYNIERCQGAPCSSFSEIGTSTGTTFSNTGLSAGTPYSYRVRARDAVPNYSGYAGPLAVTTAADSQAPSTPAGLAATPASATQINLTWTASTDNVGVTGYVVERCQGSGCTSFAQIAAPSGTSFNDTGRTPATTYRYQVRARDAVPNTSNPTTPVAAATPADTSAPSVPTTPAAAAASASGINVTWTASTDNVGVAGYNIERCQGASCTSFAQIATPAASPFADAGLSPNTSYRYRMRARDAVPNFSAYTANFSATTQVDSSAPSVPGNFTATPTASGVQVNLNWIASTDNVAVSTYRVERCQGSACSNFAEVGTPTSNSFNNTGLAMVTTYRFRVRARDAAGNNSAYAGPINVITLDGQAPTTPGAPTLTPAPGNVLLAWTASSDNVGVVAYLVERCVTANCAYAEVGTTATNSYVDTSVAATTGYTYRVRARDAANNYSSYSTSGSAVSADCD